MKKKVNGSFCPLREYELREDSDDWVRTAENLIHPCSFETFRMFWLTHYPKLQIMSPAYDTCATCFNCSCNLSVILRKAKDNDIFLRINKWHCPNSNVFDEGQEAGIELIDLPDLIDRDSVELNDTDDDSSQASSNASSQSLSQDRGGDEDDERLVHDDLRYTGSEKDLTDERDNFVKEMYKHTLAWFTQRDYVEAKEKESKADYGNFFMAIPP